MFTRKLSISRVQKVDFRSLQELHNTFDTNQLLSINIDVSVYQRHLHFLVTEAFKSINKLNSQFMWDCFKINPLR